MVTAVGPTSQLFFSSREQVVGRAGSVDWKALATELFVVFIGLVGAEFVAHLPSVNRPRAAYDEMVA
jgi:hypothetical protein